MPGSDPARLRPDAPDTRRRRPHCKGPAMMSCLISRSRHADHANSEVEKKFIILDENRLATRTA